MISWVASSRTVSVSKGWNFGATDNQGSSRTVRMESLIGEPNYISSWTCKVKAVHLTSLGRYWSLPLLRQGTSVIAAVLVSTV